MMKPLFLLTAILGGIALMGWGLHLMFGVFGDGLSLLVLGYCVVSTVVGSTKK